MNYLFVMIGAFLGAIARYGVSLWLGDMTFPMATMTVNIIGCFLLGFLLTLVSLSSHDRHVWALTFGTVFLGAFTTFSAFALDALLLTLPLALLYIGIIVMAGVIFAWAGVWTACVVYTRIRKV